MLNTSSDVPSQLDLKTRDSLYIVVPMTCVYSIILVSGLFGNICTCVVIVTNKYMHTATNFYLCSLAMSDLLLLLAGLPVEMYLIWSRFPYVFGEVFCQVRSYAAETAANATVLTITAFTIERYVAICHPFLSYTVTKLSRVLKFIVGIWTLALCLAVPQAIQFGIVAHRNESGAEIPNTEECTLKRELLEHAFHISTMVFFVAPMTLITILYVLIGLRLRQARLVNPQDNSQNRVIRMLVAVVVAFFVCWAPFHCQRLLAVSLSKIKQPSYLWSFIYIVLDYISGILYYVSTTINPLLYNIMSNKFRLAFKVTLKQLCHSGSSSPQSRAYSMLTRVGYQTSFTPLQASLYSQRNCKQPKRATVPASNRRPKVAVVVTNCRRSLPELVLAGGEQLPPKR